VAKLTGESLTEAVRKALAEIALHCASLPGYDTRTPDEIIGYDEYGVPR
jgi:hypothetical protein